MTDLGALLAAVLAAPADDLPRMAYADKCRELGDDDRADFIEAQLEMARWGQHPGDDFTFAAAGKKYEFAPEGMNLAALYRRSQELLAAPHASLSGHNCGVWSAPIPVSVGLYGPEPFAFRRGFVASVRCTAEQWVFSGDAIRARHPVEAVELTTTPTNRDVEHEQTGPHEHRYRVRGKDWFNERDCETASEVQSIYLGLFALTWPGIAFTLPEPEYGLPGLRNALEALRRADSISTAYIRAAVADPALSPRALADGRILFDAEGNAVGFYAGGRLHQSGLLTGAAPPATTPTPPAGPPPAVS